MFLKLMCIIILTPASFATQEEKCQLEHLASFFHKTFHPEKNCVVLNFAEGSGMSSCTSTARYLIYKIIPIENAINLFLISNYVFPVDMENKLF